MPASLITEPPTPSSGTTSGPGAATEKSLPPAAALTAKMVRRGRDPWWGEDQQPGPPAHGDASPLPARLARARVLFDREDGAMDGANAPRETPTLGQAAAVPADDDAPLRFERRPSNFMLNVAIFLTVLMTSGAVTLYLSLRLE